jgi:hypothetical protein
MLFIDELVLVSSVMTEILQTLEQLLVLPSLFNPDIQGGPK